jgi:hypothetical protein
MIGRRVTNVNHSGLRFMVYTARTMHPHSYGRKPSLFGEALIALAALLGIAVPFGLGYTVTAHDLWLYAALLALIVIFYFFLLFARFLFVAMVSGMKHGLREAECCGGECCQGNAKKK